MTRPQKIRRSRTVPRLPFEPFWDATGADNLHQLATMLNCARSRLQEFRRDGIPETVADRWCARLGLPTGEVFGDAWFELADPARYLFGKIRTELATTTPVPERTPRPAMSELVLAEFGVPWWTPTGPRIEESIA